VYRALDELVGRGYVLAGLKRPAEYMAVDPDEVFARALAESDARRTAIVEATPILAAWWAQAAASRRSEGDAFRQLEGEAGVSALAERIVKGAARVVLILDRRPSVGSLPAPLRAAALRSALPPHAELRVVDGVARHDDPQPGRLAPASGAASSWFLVVDDKQALFLDEATPTAGRAEPKLRATWTDSPTVVAMAVALHASLWAKAAAARERDAA
jgi:sugar-specific transcriptional regulator TrmB